MKTNGRSLAIALAFAVVLVGGLVLFKDVRSGPGASPQPGSPPNASSCLTLKVLASSEKKMPPPTGVSTSPPSSTGCALAVTRSSSHRSCWPKLGSTFCEKNR